MLALFLLLLIPDRQPTLQRLLPENLKKMHQEVAALDRQRVSLAPADSLLDLRCILHCHSDLSHDSRGTMDEIVAAAKRARVEALFVTDHPQQQDVVAAQRREEIDDVLIVPGAEANGFLIFPTTGRVPPLNLSEQKLIDSIRSNNGLIFIAHPEEHKDWNLRGLTGMEIYNTHADVKDETELLEAMRPKDAKAYFKLLQILNAINEYPQEGFAALFDPPAENLKHFDSMCTEKIYAAIAGNDSHQNTGFILRGADNEMVEILDALGNKMGEIDASKNPIIDALVGKVEPGKELLRRILDPYEVSFRYVSTHVLARERTVASLRQSLAQGRTYVAFDWLADPAGFFFGAKRLDRTWRIGDQAVLARGVKLQSQTPVPAIFHLICDGKECATGKGREFSFEPDKPGLYRLEVSVTLNGEERPWIYTGAVRLTKP
jgi:hypothetical protein